MTREALASVPGYGPIGYVLKRYPRYSETFVVNEILALERAGVGIRIFSLRSPEDGHFQDSIARVRAGVTYHLAVGRQATELWPALEQASEAIPDIWSRLEGARGSEPRHVYQALRIATDVRREKIAHLHAHFATEATSVARLAAHFAGVPYSFTAHAKDIFHESVSLEALSAKLVSASLVVTVSDFNARFLRHVAGASGARIARVYNGLELSGFPYAEPSERPARVVAVGRLVEKKGFSHLIDACALLREWGVDHGCDIVGAGPLEADLRAQVRALQLEDTVRLLGPRPQAELRDILQRAAVFAAPCVTGRDGNRDGLPTVLVEAMALGTPCVSTDVTGIPELLRHDETGLSVPQADAPALADALERLLGDAGLRVRLARAARRRVEAEFDVERNASQLLERFRAARECGGPALELAS